MPATNEVAKSMFAHLLVIQMDHLKIVMLTECKLLGTDLVLLAVELECGPLPSLDLKLNFIWLINVVLTVFRAEGQVLFINISNSLN